MAIGFFVLRYLGQRFYFHEPRRADVAALAVVLAFVLGAYWPLSVRFGSDNVAAPPAAAPAPAPAPGRVQNVSSNCKATALQVQPPGYGHIDSLSTSPGVPTDIPGGASIRGASFYVARGWVVDAGRSVPAKAACLVVDGHVEPKALSYYGYDRPDVAAGLHTPGLARSGFEILFRRDALTDGKHHIQVAAEAVDGSVWVVQDTLDLDVSPSGGVTREAGG
jgi:hypothetical protein